MEACNFKFYEATDLLDSKLKLQFKNKNENKTLVSWPIFEGLLYQKQIMYFVWLKLDKQVDILISKNWALQMLYLKHHDCKTS